MRQRVFEGQPAVVVDGFPAAMSHCAEAFWTLRWRSLNPNITVQGFRTAGGLGGLTPESAADGPIPGATTAGYISGFFCQQPAFAFGRSSDTGNLVDVVIEVQHWVAAA